MNCRNHGTLAVVLLVLLCGGALHAQSPAAPPPDNAAQARDWNGRGVDAFNAAKFALAETCFAQAARLDPTGALYVTNDALCWQRQARPDRAVAVVTAALPRFAKAEDRHALQAALADAQSAWAQKRVQAAAYDDALAHYRAALHLHLALESPDAVGDLCGMCGIWSFQTHYQQAQTVANQAVILARALKSPEMEANALLARSSIAQTLTRYGPAADDARQAAQLFHDAKNGPGEGGALQRLGEGEYYVRGYDAAADDFARALALFHAAGSRDDEASVLADWAGFSVEVSRYAQAITLYRQALAIGSQDRFVQASVLGGLANAESDLGQFTQSQADFSRALALARSLSATVMTGQILTSIGWTRDRAGQPAQAVLAFQKALAVQRPAQDMRGAAYSLGDLGVAYQHLGQFRRAIAQYDLSLPLIRQTQERRLEGRILDWRGWALACLGRHDAALADLTQALGINREARDGDGEGLTLAHLMSACRTRGRPRLAVFYGKQAVNAYQHVRSDMHGLEAAAQKSYIQSNESTYRTLADLLIGQGRLPEAQQVLGLLKQQELTDFLRGGADGTGGHLDLSPAEQAEDAQYQKIADQVTALGRQKQALLDKNKQSGAGGATFTPADQTQLDALTGQLTAATRHLQTFLAHLADSFDAPSPENRTLQNRLAAIQDNDDLQDTLRQLHTQGQDVVVLETVVAPDRYAVIVTTAQSQKVAQFPIKAADLGRKVAAFQAALRNPGADPRPLAQALYKIIVAPIEQDLEQAGARTLMWSLDGTLRYVPIAALYDGKRYLVERFDNEVFTLGRRSGFGQDEHTQWEGLGLGVSQAHTDFNPLPAVPDELRGVIHDTATPGAVGVVPGEMLLDLQFTQAAMTHALQQGKYTMVHIASHFALKPGDPDGSFLLLGDGGHLSLSDVAADHTLFAGVDMLALSACNTAMSDPGADGKEVDSLGSIAQRDGAKSVLASLWPVADSSTRLLMENFYRAHQAQSDLTKTGALRQAQLALLHGTTAGAAGDVRGTKLAPSRGADPAFLPFTPDPHAPYAHPFYWAPFVLIGNWR